MKTIDDDGIYLPLSQLIEELSFRFHAATYLADEVINGHGVLVGTPAYALANTVRMIHDDVQDMLEASDAAVKAQRAAHQWTNA